MSEMSTVCLGNVLHRGGSILCSILKVLNKCYPNVLVISHFSVVFLTLDLTVLLDVHKTFNTQWDDLGFLRRPV